MKAYTDLGQSKKLAEILPLKTADMRYGYIAPYDYSDRMFDGGYDEVPYSKDFLKRNPNFSENEYDGELPCWSLAALLEVLPNLIDCSFKTLNFLYGWHCAYMNGNGEILNNDTTADNPVDACYEMIVKLKEQNLI